MTMISDRPTLEDFASQIANCVRRHPEFRQRPNSPAGLRPVKLLGIIDNHAVYRRLGGTVAVARLKDFDAWTIVDKDGNALPPKGEKLI
jgi:hypothetical protein